MRVLIACEESGIVRRAFRARGHNAWSCDLLPAADGDQHHYRCTLQHVLSFSFDWDLMIAHPPCTHLSVSGARWLTDHWVTKKSHPEGRYWHDGSEKRRLQVEALDFVRYCMQPWHPSFASMPRIAIENPISVISSKIRKPDQIIHPWQFGHGERKPTCLWLKNLPLLVPTNEVPGREQRIWRMPPGPERARLRSRTYEGIADAMADQWGSLAA